MSKNKKIFGVLGVIAVAAYFIISGMSGGSSAAEERLSLEITTPAGRASVTEASIAVTGIVSNPLATVKINDEVVEVSDEGAFAHNVALDYGSNRISVSADHENMRASNRVLTVPRNMTLVVDNPADNANVSDRRITVSGNVSDTNARVMVAGSEVAVNSDDGAWSTDLDLHYALTIINVTARLDGIDPITHLISVNYGADDVSTR